MKLWNFVGGTARSLMIDRYDLLAASRLWKAPRWKTLVLLAITLTAVVIVKLFAGSGSVSPRVSPMPAALKPAMDPAAEARLAEYERAFTEAAKLSGPAQRCEAFATAFSGLTPDDVQRGKSILMSDRNRIREIADGERCAQSLAISDGHFVALSQAVATADAKPDLHTLEAVRTAYRAIDAFDETRSRFQTTDRTLLERAKANLGLLDDSDRRVDAIVKASDTFTADGSASHALATSEALRQLTELDRSRMNDRQRAAAGKAEEAARLVQASRGRLQKLAPLLAATGTVQPTTDQQLVETTAAITPFDEQVATSDQTQILKRARSSAAPIAWNLMEDRLGRLGRDKSAANYRSVADIYGILKTSAQTGLTDNQQRNLREAEEAVKALVASDTRLRELIDAKTIWDQKHARSGLEILIPLHAITPFDQTRFTASHKEAFGTLARADGVLRGPEIGLTASTKSRLPVFVHTMGNTALDGSVADALRNALHNAGYSIIPDRENAAVITEVSVESLSEPASDFSGAFALWISRARVRFNASWAVDESPLLEGDIAATGRSQDRDAVRTDALQSAVAGILGRFDALAAHPP